MSINNRVEFELGRIDQGSFQKLCNDILLKMGYNLVESTGSVISENKTSVGTPDSFFKDSNGKNVFAEYTTRKSDIVNKFKDDIAKCLDYQKTGYKSANILEIFCFHNSKLNTVDISEIELQSNEDTKINVIGLQAISYMLINKYKSLLSRHLDIEYSDQLVETDIFIEKYNDIESNIKIGRKIVGRENEVKDVLDSLKSNDFVILYGYQGYGKTEIALNVLKVFCEANPNYQSFSLINKHLDYYNDIMVTFEKGGKYLIFLDDINTHSHNNLIFSILEGNHIQAEFKIIATIRDYALRPFVETMIPFKLEPSFYEISKPTKELIIKILDQEKATSKEKSIIAKVTIDNPRFALMMLKLIRETIEENRKMNINDVSDLIGYYFRERIHNLNDLDMGYLKLLGVTSFYGYVNLDNTLEVEKICNYLEISTEELISIANDLEEKELCFIDQGKILSINDQTFSTFIYYSCFFSEKSNLSYGTLLNLEFHNFSRMIIESINSVINCYDFFSFEEKLKIELRIAFEGLSVKKYEMYKKLLFAFYVLFPEETLLEIKKDIETSENDFVTGNEMFFEDEKKVVIPEYIYTLLHFIPNLEFTEMAIELMLTYIRKSSNFSKNARVLREMCTKILVYSLDIQFVYSIFNFLDNNDIVDSNLLKLKTYKVCLAFGYETTISNGREIIFSRNVVTDAEQNIVMRKYIFKDIIDKYLLDHKYYKESFHILVENEFSFEANKKLLIRELGLFEDIILCKLDFTNPYHVIMTLKYLSTFNTLISYEKKGELFTLILSNFSQIHRFIFERKFNFGEGWRERDEGWVKQSEEFAATLDLIACKKIVDEIVIFTSLKSDYLRSFESTVYYVFKSVVLEKKNIISLLSYIGSNVKDINSFPIRHHIQILINSGHEDELYKMIKGLDKGFTNFMYEFLIYISENKLDNYRDCIIKVFSCKSNTNLRIDPIFPLISKNKEILFEIFDLYGKIDNVMYHRLYMLYDWSTTEQIELFDGRYELMHEMYLIAIKRNHYKLKYDAIMFLMKHNADWIITLGNSILDSRHQSERNKIFDFLWSLEKPMEIVDILYNNYLTYKDYGTRLESFHKHCFVLNYTSHKDKIDIYFKDLLLNNWEDSELLSLILQSTYAAGGELRVYIMMQLISKLETLDNFIKIKLEPPIISLGSDAGSHYRREMEFWIEIAGKLKGIGLLEIKKYIVDNYIDKYKRYIKASKLDRYNRIGFR